MAKYMTQCYIVNLGKQIEHLIKGYSHCCGMCKHWEEYADYSGYGDCKLGVSTGMGFDCLTGRECNKFDQARKIEYSLKVVE